MLPEMLIASRRSLEKYSRSLAMGVPYDGGRILCRLLGEFPAFVATGDLGIGPRLILDGFWEAWVTLALARYVQPGMLCVDVGANYGYYTLLMAAAAGPEGRVLACEPHPLLAEQLLPANLTLNGFESRVAVCPLAISDRDGQVVEFGLHGNNVGSSSLASRVGVRIVTATEGEDLQSRNGDGRAVLPYDVVQRARVQTATLDSLCADWPRLDLVKIDVEGAEALVWEGMQETLRRFRHAVVVMELHLAQPQSQLLSLLHEIERVGYHLRHVNYEGNLTLVDPATILGQPREHWMLWLSHD